MKSLYTVLFVNVLAGLSCGDLLGDQESIVLSASDKPFAEFVAITTKTSLPALPLPSTSGKKEPLESVSDLVWAKISSRDLHTNGLNQIDFLQTLKAMCDLRQWLMNRDSYANLLYSAFITKEAAFAVISGLANRMIEPDKAREVFEALGGDPPIEKMLRIVENTLPGSTTLGEVKERGEQGILITDLAWKLSQEYTDGWMMMPEDLIDREHFGALFQYVGISITIRISGRLIVDYASRGGNLNLPLEQLEAEMKRLIPELLGTVDPSNGERIDAEILSFMMEDVRIDQKKKADKGDR